MLLLLLMPVLLSLPGPVGVGMDPGKSCCCWWWWWCCCVGLPAVLKGAAMDVLLNLWLLEVLLLGWLWGPALVWLLWCCAVFEREARADMAAPADKQNVQVQTKE
jgi:hypothetical protein